MIFCYQNLIPNCSAIAKTLFALTAGQRRRGKVKPEKQAGSFKKLKPTDWTNECDSALNSLKEKLLNCTVLGQAWFKIGADLP